MWEALTDAVQNVAGDVKRGWNASAASLMTGKLTALAVSGPLIILLALATPLGVAAALVIGATVQLLLGWAIAGRAERRRGG